MSDMIPVWMKCELEPVPKDIEGQEWHDWCEEHDMDALANSADENRGAWISGLRTYLRGADYLVYIEGMMADIIYQEDLDNPERFKVYQPPMENNLGNVGGI